MTDTTHPQAALLHQLRQIGPHAGLQIVPTIDHHELLTDPQKGGAPLGDLSPHAGVVIGPGFQVFNVYVNGAEKGMDLADFDAFTRAIVEDGYYISPDASQYNGAFLGNALQVNRKFRSVVADATLSKWVDSMVGHGLPADTAAPINYVLIMPAGLAVSMGRGAANRSCSGFCGYHTHSPAGHYYSVLADPGCQGCHGEFTPREARMAVASHELGEWISDPLGNGWYNDRTGAENGDQCAWQLKPWGPPANRWTVQPLWQNGSVGCSVIPPYRAG